MQAKRYTRLSNSRQILAKHDGAIVGIVGGIGAIRLILASSVVIEHSSQGKPLFNFVNGIIAVQSFYMISGFYMAMILSKKYHRYSTFITNRFLRIYPLYFVVLGLTILVAIVLPTFFHQSGPGSYYQRYYNEPGFWSLLPVILTNLTVFGQDIVMFLGVDIPNANLYFTRNFLWSDPGLWNFLLVPQAWTLSLELVFYLLAPFITKWKTTQIIGLVAWSLALRFLLAKLGYTGDPWTYRFFPNEIAFFGAGILSYRIFDWLRKYHQQPLSRYAGWVSGMLFACVLSFSYIPVIYDIKRWGYYLIFWLALPWVFYYSEKNMLDRKIGELSYPVYISHLLILGILQISLFQHIFSNTMILSLSVLGLTYIFSLLLNQYIQHPIDRFRQQRLKNST